MKVYTEKELLTKEAYTENEAALVETLDEYLKGEIFLFEFLEVLCNYEKYNEEVDRESVYY